MTHRTKWRTPDGAIHLVCHPHGRPPMGAVRVEDEPDDQLTRSEIRNLIRILYGENPAKLYSLSERDALGNKLTRLREVAPRDPITD